MSTYELPDLISRWGLQPEARAEARHSGMSAAIWSGGRASAAHELVGVADPSTLVLSVALASYRCDASADNLPVRHNHWSPGELQLMPAGVTPRAVFHPGWKLLHVYVPMRTIEEALDGRAEGLEMIDPAGRQDPLIRAMARELIVEMAGDAPLSGLKVDSLGLGLAVQLVRRWSNVGSRSRGSAARGGLSPRQLRRACEAMEARLADDIGLEALAAITGCSPTHFSRAFKQSTGMPPFQWLLERRIERAKSLLGDPRASLSDVALSVGFAAQPQFTTAFKRVTGSTPGAWRRERCS